MPIVGQSVAKVAGTLEWANRVSADLLTGVWVGNTLVDV